MHLSGKKIQNLSTTSKQFGLGLLELMLVIALIALVFLVALRYYNLTQRSKLVHTATEDVSLFITSIKAWGNTQVSFSSITFGDLYKQGLLPDVFKNATTETDKQLQPGPTWDGCPSDILLEPSLSGTAISIQFSKLSPKVCQELAQKLAKDKAKWLQINTTSCHDQSCDATFRVTIKK